MHIYNPYTYLIGWTSKDKWYYGVRYSKKANPKELFKTYFTSSKHVKEAILLYGVPDVIQIRKTFDSVDKARMWEHKVLRRMKVVDKENWINKTDNISICPKQALVGASKRKSDDTKLKMSISRLGKKHTPETIEKMRLKALGRQSYWKDKKLYTETKVKISESLKNHKNLNSL